MRDWQRLVGAQWAATHLAARDLDAQLSAANALRASIEREVGEAVADRESALTRVAEVEVSLTAAQHVAASVADPMFAYHALLNSRILRWGARSRKVYRKLRRNGGR
jgi:hypothetical protein